MKAKIFNRETALGRSTSHKLMYHLERGSNGNMNEFKVENQRHPEMKLRADWPFKGWAEGRTEPKGDFPKIFLKKEKQSKKENILSRKEEGNCQRLSIFYKPDTVLGWLFIYRWRLQ